LITSQFVKNKNKKLKKVENGQRMRENAGKKTKGMNEMTGQNND